MSDKNQNPPIINFSNVVVDHSQPVVYKQAHKETFVPEFAKQQLKSNAGGKTRTFKGATTVVSSGSGPVITSKGPSVTLKASSGPQISIATATGDTAPKRIAQPVGTAAAAPVPYGKLTREDVAKLDYVRFIARPKFSQLSHGRSCTV